MEGEGAMRLQQHKQQPPDSQNDGAASTVHASLAVGQVQNPMASASSLTWLPGTGGGPMATCCDPQSGLMELLQPNEQAMFLQVMQHHQSCAGLPSSPTSSRSTHMMVETLYKRVVELEASGAIRI